MSHPNDADGAGDGAGPMSAATKPRRDPRNGRIRYTRLFITDLVGDTCRLSIAAMGVYMRMYCAAITRQDHLPDDPDQIAKLIGITKNDWMPIRDELVDFDVVEPIDGVLFDRRVQHGIDEFQASSKRNAANVAKRYRASGRLEDAS